MVGMPKIYSEYSDKFKRIYVADVLGMIMPGGLEVTVYSEQGDVKEALETQPVSANQIKVKRIIECDLIINPMEMKNIHKWLGGKIKAYEEAFGQIPSPEEVQSRLKQRKPDDESLE